MDTPVRHRILLALVPLVVAAVSLSGLFRNARAGVSDLLFGLRRAPADIVIIAIDEHSIQTIGQWPWPRAQMAQALARLSSAKAVGIDINYKEPSRLGTADDQALADAMRALHVPPVLASEMQPNGNVIGPIPVLSSRSWTGLANLTTDPDGTARAAQLSRNGVPAFATQLARAATGRTVPLPAAPVRIRYVGPEKTVPSYPFTDLVSGRVPADALAGRIVLIGATARDLQDFRQTPLGLMSGVEIQANILDNVLRDDFLRTSPATDAIVTLLAGIVGILLALRVRRISVMVLSCVALIALVWVIVFISFDRGFLIDLLMPTAAVIIGAGTSVIARYLATAQERHFIHDTFSRYLAPQIIAQLLQDPSKVSLGGEHRDLTILFSDIRGFTTLSETMGPQELSQFLRSYLGVMTDIILSQQGVIDKYIGDAIMAFWGAPLDDAQHALHGVLSALAMVAALEKFNAHSRSVGQPAIDIGIGLNAGSVVVGNMGSEKRFDYTVIGDEVNLASRLEGLTKTYGVGIIVSENILSRISAADRASHGVVSREIDRVKVKGKNKPVTIHEIVSPARAQHLAPYLDLFTAGLAHYYAGRWTEAIASFEQFLAAVGTDGPAQVLLERCQGFLHRPAENWEGAYEMKHK